MGKFIKKFKKLSMLVIGMALLTLTCMPLAHSAVITVGPSSSGADYNDIFTATYFAAQQPEKTVEVWAGTYNEGILYLYPSYYNGVTVRAKTGDFPVLNGGYYINADNVTIEGLEVVSGSGSPAFYVDSGSGCSILNSYINSQYGYGSIWLAWGNPTNVLIQGNVIFSGLNYGILSTTNGTVTIDHNTIYNNSKWGIFQYYYVTPTLVTVTNNMIVSNPYNGMDQGYTPYGVLPVEIVSNWNDVYPNQNWAKIKRGANDIMVDPVFSSIDPVSVGFLYLSCDTPDAVFYGASDGGFIGALPIFGAIRGDEALLSACKEGRALVKATPGWDQPRNPGQGKGQGVLLNMPLIAHVASDYVDSLTFCDPEDADELQSCIVSYFASGGKSSHFGE